MSEDDIRGTARGTVTSAAHGANAPRGQDPLAGAAAGRFGRMFPALPARGPDLETLEALAVCMSNSAAGDSPFNGKIPAGYTYLGQFIDHDITFDPTSNIQRRNDPHALVNFRTPRFDLDSMYGGGPADQPFLYDWSGDDPGVRLLLDTSEDAHRPRFDLPRNRQGRALIGDGRNDENAIVSQLHLLFIRMHNRVVTELCSDHPRTSRTTLFEKAQQLVRWHYQWVIISDYLPKIVGEGNASVVPSCAALPGDVAIPVEFSAAAFRFGHTMVREDYQLKKSHLPTAATPAVPILGAEGDQHTLSGFRKLKRAHEIEWDLFFFDPEGPHADTANFSMRLDPSLASPLFSLPPDNVSLASLNLHRGRALGLPAGSDVADLLGIAPLTPDELTPTEVLPGIDALAGLESVLAAPPLWYYILCEALARGVDPHPPAGSGTAHPPAKGVRLGDVGGRIVAEVLVGLLERDPRSYVHQVAWKPHLGKRGEFTMVDLVEYAQADPGS